MALDGRALAAQLDDELANPRPTTLVLQGRSRVPPPPTKPGQPQLSPLSKDRPVSVFRTGLARVLSAVALSQLTEYKGATQGAPCLTLMRVSPTLSTFADA
jgi:hypothetical protein